MLDGCPRLGEAKCWYLSHCILGHGLHVMHAGASIASRKMVALAAGGLDAVAAKRGITNRADDDDAGGWLLGMGIAASLAFLNPKI